MSITTNQNSILWQLRRLMPGRPLTQFEAYRLAELQANRFLAMRGVEGPGTPSEVVSGLPFVEVRLRRDLPASGLTNWYKPRWLILLNGHEPHVRRRFSLMHEFKHVLDHNMSERLYPTTALMDHDERVELVAEYFAACVLMPKRLVKQAYFGGRQSVTDLANDFAVSTNAMRYRLSQLRVIETYGRHERPYRDAPGLTGYLRRAGKPVETAA